MESVRDEVDAFLTQQAQLGQKRRDIVLVLTHRNFTERQISLIMKVNPKTIAAMKVDNSKKGRKKWKVGSRIHLDTATAQLKRVQGKKVTGLFVSMCEKLIAEEEQKKGAQS